MNLVNRMALNSRISFTQYVQGHFYLKYFLKPLCVSGCNFPYNVLKPVQQAALTPATPKRCCAVILPRGSLGALFPEESLVLLWWGFACCRRTLHTCQRQQWSFPSQFLAETCCCWSSAFFWTGTASGLSWRMESGLILRFFMQLSHPISGHTPERQLSLSKHPCLSTACRTCLCADSYSKLKLYHPGVSGTSSCSPVETSLSFKIHNVTNKRKSDFVTGCLLKNQICSFR